jgi:hypothetical protein
MQTNPKKHPTNKTEPAPQTVLWHTKNRHTHTKKKQTPPTSFLISRKKVRDALGDLPAI